MYITYTCRCVCMKVYYEEDILWYSTKLMRHNNSHKINKEHCLVFKKNWGSQIQHLTQPVSVTSLVYAIVTSKRAPKLFE